MKLVEALGMQPMVFYHGGNLENASEDFVAQKNGRYEYGPGLYLIDHLETALKYAKGSRKLYQIEVAPGVDLDDALLSFDSILAFTQAYVPKPKQKEFLEAMQKRAKDGKVQALMFHNRILNGKFVRPKDVPELRKFLVDNGIDYHFVHSPFGWGEKMLVLFNMQKIKSKKILDRSTLYSGPSNASKPS